MDRESDSPRTEFEVAVAGPAVTLAIVVALACRRRGDRGPASSARVLRDAFELKSDAAVSGFVSMLAWLAAINAFVLVFNLLPAFPMDGGRIARALVWWRTGDRNLATRYAANLGRVFAYLFIGAGLAAARPAATSSPASGWR